MFRFILAVSLACAGLSLVRTQHSCRRDSEPPRGKGSSTVKQVEEVKGYGLSVEEAKKDAQLRAAEAAAEALAIDTRDPARQEQLREYVRTHVAAGPGTELPGLVIGNETLKAWSLPLRDDADWTSLRVEERQVRARGREIEAAKVLAVVVLLLGASFLCCRRWR